MEEFIPSRSIEIKDLQTLKVIADPLRNQILESLTLEPMTVRQVAEKLGLSPKKLYYHVGLLETHGLIKVVETRVVSNIIEKIYRAAAFSLEVAPALCCFASDEGKESINASNAAILDVTRQDLERSLEARAVQLSEGAAPHPRRMIVYRELSRLAETRAHEFQKRLDALFRDFEAANVAEPSSGDDLHTYALTIAFYPRFYYPDSENETEPSD